jgi:hypothetical protein
LYELGLLRLQETEFRVAPHEFFITLSRSAKGCGLSREELLHQTQRELSECDASNHTQFVNSINRIGNDMERVQAELDGYILETR